MKKRFALFGMGFLLTLFSVKFINAMGDAQSTVEPEFKSYSIPNFSLPDLDGKSFEFSSLAGKVIIVDFWATWCPPCQEEIPHFIELRERYHVEGLEILGVSLDEEGASVVKPFAKHMKINYPLVLGNDEVIDIFGGIIGLPTTFIVNREGQVVDRFIGYVDKKTIEETIKKYL